MHTQDYRLNTSMAVLGKHTEGMKKRNEASLLNNEMIVLESELQKLGEPQSVGFGKITALPAVTNHNPVSTVCIIHK